MWLAMSRMSCALSWLSGRTQLTVPADAPGSSPTCASIATCGRVGHGAAEAQENFKEWCGVGWATYGDGVGGGWAGARLVTHVPRCGFTPSPRFGHTYPDTVPRTCARETHHNSHHFELAAGLTQAAAAAPRRPLAPLGVAPGAQCRDAQHARLMLTHLRNHPGGNTAVRGWEFASGCLCAACV